MKETKKRTLYECSYARVRGDRICCSRGNHLLPKSADGCIGIGRLARGNQLAFQVCQNCPDFDRMGPPVPKEERGWFDEKGGRI